jgi:uracil-DNA glycosylase
MDIKEKEIIEYLRLSNFNLPSNLRPVLQLSSTSSLLIIGPAPGIRAHNTGTPWNDASGDRLRAWLGITKDEFYDKNKVALISMNFWYPGVNKYGGDNPPSIANAELWHRPLLSLMPNIKLTLLVGYSAQSYYLKERVKPTLTETVKSWQGYLPKIIVLPHPSWHNNVWIKKHKWFEDEIIPELRIRVKKSIN